MSVEDFGGGGGRAKGPVVLRSKSVSVVTLKPENHK